MPLLVPTAASDTCEHHLRRPLLWIMALLCSVTLVACAGTTPPAAEQSDTTGSTRTVTVFAAKSLYKAFTRIADEVLAKEHPTIKVAFSFQGSQMLTQQLNNGAQADILATADEDSLARLQPSLLAGPLHYFAVNSLRLTVPVGNPAGITGLDDSLTGKKLVICAPRVPCGNAAQKLAAAHHVVLRPVSEENNVGSVRTKLETGQADVGLIYLTDVKAAGDKVEIVPVPGISSIRNRYPLALLRTAQDKQAAQLFLDAVLSEAGQAILHELGFRAAG